MFSENPPRSCPVQGQEPPIKEEEAASSPSVYAGSRERKPKSPGHAGSRKYDFRGALSCGPLNQCSPQQVSNAAFGEQTLAFQGIE